MNDFTEQVSQVLESLTIHSPVTYSWFGRALPRLPSRVVRAMTPRTARSYLLHSLASELYSSFYLPGRALAVRREADSPAMGTAPFIDALSAANAGGGCWESGWEVRALAAEEVVVRRRGLDLWVRRADCRVPGGAALAPGTQVDVRFPNELRGISPGFYMAVSDHGFDEGGVETIVRIYWNLTAAGATPWLRAATRLLNQARLCFRLKVLDEPAMFTRCDAAVIYIPRSQFAAAAEPLGRIHEAVVAYLKPDVPALTKPLVPGLGLAEDPGHGKSFGEHRCSLLAEGAVRAYEQRESALATRLAVVAACFGEAGISMDTPYLNPGSPDNYSLSVGR